MNKTTGRRVAVTGVGMVSPFGGDTTDFFERMLAGESAIRLYQHPPSPSRLAQPAVTCAQFDAEKSIGRAITRVTDRYSQLGVAAAFSAWDDAGLAREGAGSDEYGVSWGTGTGGMLTYEKGYGDMYLRGRQRVSPLSVPMAMNNAAASHIAMALGLGSACLTYSVACASSTISIGEAFRRIQRGESSLIVAGGSESPLAFTIMRAWEALHVVAAGDERTAHRACRPFQQGRTGLVLGEGAAALVLEDWAHAKQRGARIYCELAGFGQSCDHAHLVRPDAQGQSRAIQAALREADLAPEQVGYVNAHGTATPEGDPTEISALKQVFGAHAEHLAVSATKSMHGHSLGAVGATEALITVLALARQAIPPTAHLEQVAEDCLGVRHVMGSALRDVPLQAAISNSFAFGGSNAVLAFRATRDS
ncbi:MAG TPA: beta-ketoacyl-[acyl-carrier-protein] synthase family protein [Rhodoferax sp.]